ncbi:unnamed protein product [Urochloa humidicola]
MSAAAPAPAVMAEELEATWQKTRSKKHMEQAVVPAPSSVSPRLPATPDSKVEFPAPVTPETLTPIAAAVGKGRKRKKEEVPAASLLVEEAVPPSPAAAAASAQILQVAAEGMAARKVRRWGKLEQGHSGQPPSPVDVHPQGGEASTDGGVGGSKSVSRRSSGMPRVLSKRELLRMKLQSAKGKPLREGFFPFIANPNYMDQGYCSPYDPFFAQFCYIPEPRQGCNAPSHPKTPDPPARLSPRDHPSILSSQLTENEAFLLAKTTASNTKRPPSASGPQEEVKVKEKKRLEKEMSGEKTKKKSPSFSAAEKRSDVYRRLPLDQLVPPPRSPHKLLQENYAHDPWKVIVICMMLNCTSGNQVKEMLKGFFERYPDAQTASTADLEKMAEYLASQGFQNVKSKRIQRFSKGYVGDEWTYITELCGVGKYAADAYAIFCAGRATEVVPNDHKLVDYWNYVRKLPAETKQNVPEAAGEAGQLCP